MGKADDDEVERILKSLDLTWDDLVGDIDPLLLRIAKDGAREGLRQLDISVGVATDLANESAQEYAKFRAAELVGKKWVDGELVDNPNAEWSINESTREMLRGDIADAIEEGWSNDELVAALEDNYAFSPERAEMVARTETAMADVQGNAAAYKAAEKIGIKVKKKWITAEDDLVSDECRANGEQDPIDMDEEFVSGAAWPPQHPNCRCDILPVVDEEESDGDEETEA